MLTHTYCLIAIVWILKDLLLLNLSCKASQMSHKHLLASHFGTDTETNNLSVYKETEHVNNAYINPFSGQKVAGIRSRYM